MGVTDTSTVQTICQDALEDIGVIASDEPATPHDLQIALRHLNRLLKSWQGELEFLETSATLTLTTAASYTLSPVRPFRIVTARLKRDGIEIPMTRLSRIEYDELPDKDATGLPTQYYYDRQREAAVFYVWPMLATAAGETIEYTYEREIEDMTLSSDLDVPGEWYDAVVLCLADRLQLPFEKVVPGLSARADRARRSAMASEPGSIMFKAG